MSWWVQSSLDYVIIPSEQLWCSGGVLDRRMCTLHLGGPRFSLQHQGENKETDPHT